MIKKAILVIPTYNEGKNIGRLIDSLRSEFKKIDNYKVEMLVVDANSQDNTQTIAKRKGVKLLAGEKRGLGFDLKRGFDYAVSELNADVICEMDADLSHNPKDVKRLLAKLSEGYDLALGSRYIKGGSIPDNWALHRKFLSKVGNILLRIFFGRWSLKEYTTNFRAFTASFYKRLNFDDFKKYHDFTFVPVFVYKAILAKAKMVEVPIKFTDREYGKSKIIVPEYAPNLLRYSLKVFLKRIFRL